MPDPDHYRDFLECIRTRRPPNAAIATAHPSNVAVHMGNIAHRIGNFALVYDAASGRFDDDRANALLKPTYRKGYEIPAPA